VPATMATLVVRFTGRIMTLFSERTGENSLHPSAFIFDMMFTDRGLHGYAAALV